MSALEESKAEPELGAFGTSRDGQAERRVLDFKKFLHRQEEDWLAGGGDLKQFLHQQPTKKRAAAVKFKNEFTNEFRALETKFRLLEKKFENEFNALSSPLKNEWRLLETDFGKRAAAVNWIEQQIQSLQIQGSSFPTPEMASEVAGVFI